VDGGKLMIPGIQGKLSEETIASASTIDVKTDIVEVTGTTSIATINKPHQGGFSAQLFVIPTDGNVATLTTGNIPVAVTMPQNRATLLVYSKSNNKWYPGAIS
jgi:hypothetical protein